MQCTDTYTLAAALERAWDQALPGREVAERNALLCAAQYEAHPRVRQQEMHHERSQPATLRAMSAARICVHRARTDGCVDCGCELSQEALDAGRDMCFECYVHHQG